MPWQLIYTSAPRGLKAGQSGLGVVARSEDMREALILRLERLSSNYPKIPAAPVGPLPDVAAYRILDLRGVRYHVLSRIQYSGLDFTNRPVQLAHHLAFEPRELGALPSPAILFLQWDGWRRSWTDGPRWLGPGDLGNLGRMPVTVLLPARAWQSQTQDAGRAAALISPPHQRGCDLACATGGERALLELFADSLQLLNPEGRTAENTWSIPFTTALQAGDDEADFRWRGRDPAGPTAQSLALWDPSSLAVPTGPATEWARHGYTRPTGLTGVVPSQSGAYPSSSRSVPAPVRHQLVSPTPRLKVQIGAVADESPRSRASSGGHGIRLHEREPRSWWIHAARIAAVIVVLLLAAVGAKTVFWSGSILPDRTAIEVPPNSTNSPAPNALTAAVQAPATSAPPDGLFLSKKIVAADPVKKALAQLTNAVALPTTILVGKADETFTLPDSHPLAQALRICFKQIVAKGMECHSWSGSFATLLAAGTNRSPAALDLQPSLGTGTLELPGGASLKLNFQQLTAERVGTSEAAVELRMEKLTEPVAIEFRATAAGRQTNGQFAPFLLVWWLEQKSIEPCRLNLGLLKENQASARESMHEDFRGHVTIIHRNKPVVGELRAYVRTTNGLKTEWLYEHWLGDLRPNADLDFATARTNAASWAKRLREKLSIVKEQREFLAKDTVLGRMPRSVPDYPSHPFESFCSSNNLRVSSENYVSYLTNSLAGILYNTTNALPVLVARLLHPGTRETTLLDLGKFLTTNMMVPPSDLDLPLLISDHFSKRHAKPVRTDRFWASNESVENDGKKWGGELRRIRELQNRLPWVLASLHHVNLSLPIAKGRTLQFFRFEAEADKALDPTPESPPNSHE